MTTHLFEIVLIALALAADAFTVGLAVGVRHHQPRQRFRLCFHFGLFQALFPLAGFFVGTWLQEWIAPWDHWLILGVLAVIGTRMMLNAFHEDVATLQPHDLTRGMRLIGLSSAVSVDALGVGFTLGLIRVPVVLSVTIIGVITAMLTLVGMLIAPIVVSKLGKRVEFVAGGVLVGLGVRIWVQHFS